MGDAVLIRNRNAPRAKAHVRFMANETACGIAVGWPEEVSDDTLRPSDRCRRCFARIEDGA